MPYGTTYTVSNQRIEFSNDVVVTATSNSNTSQYVYSFAKWQLNNQDLTSNNGTIFGEVTFNAIFNRSVVDCCVSGDTLVKTGLDGQTKRADELKVGDKVITFNEITGEMEEDEILNVIRKIRDRIYNVELVDGTILRITGDHPIFTNRGWVACDNSSSNYDIDGIQEKKDLQIGDKVKTEKGFVEVSNITYDDYQNGFEVFTFTIRNNHNFFANGIMVHNADCSGSN